MECETHYQQEPITHFQILIFVLLHFSSDLASLARTRASTGSLPIALGVRAAARILCSALCFSSLFAYFWIRGTDVKRIVRICALPRALPSFILLFLRVCDIRIKSGILLLSTRVVRSTLAVLGRLGIDAILILRIFPWQSEAKRLRELTVS